MFRKFLPLLILTAGVGLLYIRPVVMEKNLSALVPFVNSKTDFGKYQSFERRNQIYVVLSDPQGEIFNPTFFKTLKDVTNDIFFLPGVDRSHFVSLIDINVNFRDVTEDGFEGGPIVPEDFPYTDNGYEEIKKNLLKSPYVGHLVSYDLKSTVIVVPFLAKQDGLALTRQIERLLPNNERIHCSILGFTPFLVSLQKELTHSILALLLSWLMSCLFFYAIVRKFSLSLLIGPLVTLVLQLCFYRLSSHSLHPFVFPVIMFTMVLSFADRIWSALTSQETGTGTKMLMWTAGAAVLPAMSLYLLGSGFAEQMARLSVAGSLALLTTHLLYLKIPPVFAETLKPVHADFPSLFPVRIRKPLLWILLLTGLSAASFIFIGNRDFSPVVLRPDTPYKKAQKFMIDHFAFTADSILIPAIAGGKGCVDPANVSALEEFHWFLTGFPGVRSISSLAEAVKKLNMFFHENNLKWRSVPREQATLVLATSNLDPKTGLLDDAGLVLPVTVYLENHHPQILAPIFEGIKNFKPSSDHLSFKIAAGAATFESMQNEGLAVSVKSILLVLLGILVLATRLFLSWRQTIMLCFLFCVLLSLTLALIAVTGMGLNQDTVVGTVLSSCLCLYFLWLRLRYPAHGKKLTFLLMLACVMAAGGLVSGINFIFRASAIAEWMLILTGVLGFMLDPAEEGLEGPSART